MFGCGDTVEEVILRDLEEPCIPMSEKAFLVVAMVVILLALKLLVNAVSSNVYEPEKIALMKIDYEKKQQEIKQWEKQNMLKPLEPPMLTDRAN